MTDQMDWTPEEIDAAKALGDERFQRMKGASLPSSPAPEGPTVTKCDCGAALTVCASCAVSDYQGTNTDCATCCPTQAAPAGPQGLDLAPIKGWQPIDTAIPTTGEPVALIGRLWRQPFVGIVLPESMGTNCYIDGKDGDGMHALATHWMPLPATPHGDPR